MLSPHLSLDARHSALSHTVWAFLVFSLVIGVLKWRRPKLFTPAIAALCIAAYGFHLFCDAITGGIALFYPLTKDVQGKALLPFWLWIASDGLLLIYFYLVYRWLPLRRKLKASSRLTAPIA